MEWCAILLLDNGVHNHPPFPSQCMNELGPQECSVTVRVSCYPILIFVLKEVWPNDSISTYGTPHSYFLLAKWAMGMFMGLSLRPITHILIIDVPTYVAVNVIEESQTQQAKVVFNPLTHILMKRKSFCFIVINLPLQDLNFVRKELMIFRED